jgi:hypothetical protein
VPHPYLPAGGGAGGAGSRGGDGAASITATHDFTGEAELEALLQDLGPDGVGVTDARLTRSRGFLRSRDALAVDVDLHDASAGVAADAALAERLTAAGVDVAALDAQLTAQLDEGLSVEVALHAPDGGDRSVTVAAGESDSVALSETTFEWGRVVLLLVALGLVAVAVLLLFGAHRSRRRAEDRARRRGAGEPAAS